MPNPNTENTISQADNPEAGTDSELPGSGGLDSLLSEAEALEGMQDSQRAQAEQQAQADQTARNRAELLGALEMARALAEPAVMHWLDMQRTYSDARLAAIADSGAAVMTLHGWTVGEFMGKYAPYIALVGAVALPALETVSAYKRHQAMIAQAQRQPQAAQPVQPAQAPAANLQQGVRE